MAKSRKRISLADHQHSLAKACESPAPVTVVYGEEAFLREDAIRNLTEVILANHPGLEVISLHGGSPDGGNSVDLIGLLQELGESSLFSSEKLVVLHQGDKTLFPAASACATGTGKGKRFDPVARFLEYIQQPVESTWLVLETEGLPRNRKVGKALAAHSALIECPAISDGASISRWLTTQISLTGKSLEAGVSDILIAAHGGKLGVLKAELDKLAIYVGDAGSICREDVEAFLSGSTEFDIFGLTNALEARNLEAGLTFARKINSQGLRDMAGRKTDGQASAHRAMHMAARSLEDILKARITTSDDPRDIAQIVGTSPWRAEKLVLAARRFTIGQLRHALNTIAAESRSSHDTGADIRLSLERVVIATCG